MPLLLCPNDNGAMQTVQRSGVEFDICPTCRGVWLDRGELDKIIERSAPEAAPARQNDPPRESHSPRPGFGGGYSGYDQPYRKRKKSFLEEIFD